MGLACFPVAALVDVRPALLEFQLAPCTHLKKIRNVQLAPSSGIYHPRMFKKTFKLLAAPAKVPNKLLNFFANFPKVSKKLLNCWAKLSNSFKRTFELLAKLPESLKKTFKLLVKLCKRF